MRNTAWIYCFLQVWPVFAENSGEFCDCARSLKPVCGSNGVTYDNNCLLNCAVNFDPNLIQLHNGACCPQTVCPPITNPVCDNLGRTHLSECTLKKVRCIARKTQNRLVRKIHDGECLKLERSKEDCEKLCLHLGGPVCDLNFTTHRDECSYEKFNCELRNSGRPEHHLLHYGSCVEKDPSELPIMFSEDARSHIIGVPSSTHNMGRKAGYQTTTHLATTMIMNVTSPELRILSEEGSGEFTEIDEFDVGGQVTMVHVGGNGQNTETLVFAAEAETDSYQKTAEMADMEKLTTKMSLARKDMAADELLSTSLPDNSKVITPHSQPFDINQPCSAVECDKLWNPVCDSKNRTHKNLCLFKFYACKLNRLDGSVVAIAHEGECTPQEILYSSGCNPCPNGELTIPVCDNQNMTHESICAVSHFNCLQRRVAESERVLVHVGACNNNSPIFDLKAEICPQKCSADVKEVCDELGVTHRNLCVFQQKNCHIRKSGRLAPMLKYLRPCNRFGEVNSTSKSAESLENTTNIVQTKHSHEGGMSPKSLNSSELIEALNVIKNISSPSAFMTILPGSNKSSQEASTPKSPTSAPAPKLARSKNNRVSGSTDQQRFECPIPSCSGDTGLPICDSLGNLHENLCMFTFARCKAAQRGKILSVQPDDKCLEAHCHEECPSTRKPVCGSDFNTYANHCFFRKQKCKEKSLDVLFSGKCTECFDAPCPHLSAEAPDDFYVCDQDGNTKSLCEFKMLSCIVEKNYGLNLTIQHLGKCCEPEEPCSTRPEEPVCGADRRTYRNKCQFDVENCRNTKLEVPTTELLHHGNCTKEEEESGQDSVGMDSETKDGSMIDTLSFESKTQTVDLPADICPSSCDNVYIPVCGSDDLTYTNLCALQHAKCKFGRDITVAYVGECCEVNCPSNFMPICDNQGVTHQNLCFFGKERCMTEKMTGQNLTISKFDVCETDDVCKKSCRNTYEPVCTTKGETLVNMCELEKQNCFIEQNITAGDLVKKDYEGECCPDRKCGFKFSPVCDSDGITHANECIFEQVSCVEKRRKHNNITVQYKGQCCNQPCEDEYKPVCDGQTTHENMCRFRIAQCEAERRGDILTLAYAGECCTIPSGSCEKTSGLCDSEGQTHLNICHFRQRKCIMERTQHKILTVVHGGECCALKNCPKEGHPVCDSRGGTHVNLCHFQNTKCIHDKIHPKSSIQLSYPGICCASNCTHKWEPVCDQHGSVHRNACMFQLKACELARKSNGILLETPCPERRIRSYGHVHSAQITVT